MATFNKVILIGNLTRDPEVRYTTGGTAVANASIAVNERYTTANNEVREETCFLDLEIWGKQAETMKQYLHKGDPIFVEGRLRQESWQDKATGQTRTRLRIRVERFQMLSRGGQQHGGQQEADYGHSSPEHGYAMEEMGAPTGYAPQPKVNSFQPMPAAPQFGSAPQAPRQAPRPQAPQQAPQRPAFGNGMHQQPGAMNNGFAPSGPSFMPIDEPEDDIPF
ncbi:MAG: single-stranded DNA-binding protein [Lentisphaeria bacterium]